MRQRAVLKIGDYLIVLATTLVVVILAVAIFRGDPILQTVEFALVLLVAAIPVAMPTVLSVTMAVGARLLAKKEAIVTRLSAIEELAGVDVLCSDKTGTLTQNKLTLGDPFTVKGTSKEDVILSAALASRAEDKDTIDLAVLGGVKDEHALEVAGHLTIFLTRTRGPFWSIRPARALWIAVLGTQALATLIAVYGVFMMTPLGWGWALLVWAYALAWAVLNDRIKLLAYRIFDPTKDPLLLKNKPPRDLRPQIATRANELYEQRRDGSADKDWLQAEREIRAHS